MDSTKKSIIFVIEVLAMTFFIALFMIRLFKNNEAELGSLIMMMAIWIKWWIESAKDEVIREIKIVRNDVEFLRLDATYLKSYCQRIYQKIDTLKRRTF